MMSFHLHSTCGPLGASYTSCGSRYLGTAALLWTLLCTTTSSWSWGLWKDRGTYFTEVFKEKVKRVLPAGSIYMQRSAARGIGNDEYA